LPDIPQNTERMNLATGHQFRLFDGPLDCVFGGCHIDHHAPFDAVRIMRSQSNHFH
jgi:hypothetical protein